MGKTIAAAVCFITLILFSGDLIHAESPLPVSGISDADDYSKTGSGSEEKSGSESGSEAESITLLFIGDIMGHDKQIESAMQPDGVTYDYTSCFDYIRGEISSADLAIANLEVTLAGPPYKGYPRFSSPDALAVACKDAGIDVMVTANNHCLDRGKHGLERTIKVLDSLSILHTGTFLSYSDKKQKTPLVIEKNNFKLALLSYTYSTNEIPVPEPSFVNLAHTKKLLADIAKAKQTGPDAVILFIHWGTEYSNIPDKNQQLMADIFFKGGADIIIGSHPHVIQKSILENRYGSNHFVAYSLGNFISNQKKAKTDGGQMVRLKLARKNGITAVSDAKYMLTWTYGREYNGKKKFYVLPCKDFEDRSDFFAAPEYYNRMKEFIEETRKLLDKQNVNVEEVNKDSFHQ